jgi:TatD DNase family protein
MRREIAMEYIDTHCHMDMILAKLGLADFQAFRAACLPEVLPVALPIVFGGCITISCDPSSVPATLALMSNPGVYGAFGIHPHDAKAYSPGLEEILRKAMDNPKTVAWGEIGLDYHYNMSPPELQREVFVRQIRMGVECGKPLIIHTREAEADTLEILRSEAPRDWRIHVHCFTSSLDLAGKLLDAFPNLRLGFTGIVTFKNALDLQEVVKATPMDRFLLETDGPYLAPVPHRGKPAHPGHIPLIAQKIAELKGVTVEAVYAAARDNTREVYGI